MAKKRLTEEDLKSWGFKIVDGQAVRVGPKTEIKKELKSKDSDYTLQENILFRNFVSSLLNVHHIDIPIRAETKPRMTQSDRWKKRPCVMKYRSYKDKLKAELAKIGYSQDDILAAMFFYEMPPSWTKKKRESMFLKKYNTKPDIDNSIKAFLDGQDIEDKFIYAACVMQVWHYKSFIRIYIPKNE